MRSPLLRASFDPSELAVDSFAGGGGASTGIEAALGRPVDIAINHDPEAIALHAANHPETRHFLDNIWQVDPREACGSRPVGLAWFSPDCFPAGTMVLTRAGYRPIEEIETGDEVLTHLGRWRRVTETSSTRRPLLRFRGHGHPGLLVSPEHPFYARRRRDVWDNARRRYERMLEPADWVPASVLERGWCWASPISFPADAPPEIPSYRSRTTTIDERLIWLAGRYLADGWTRLTATRAELIITCGRHEADDLRAILSVWPRVGSRSGTDELAWSERDTSTAHQFTANHRGLVEWLREHFGHGAAEKTMPGWALGMEEPLRRALLAGYLSGDGSVSTRLGGSPIVMATTVSKALALGLKALAGSLGYSPTVYRNDSPNDVIEGRRVNARPAWSVRWRDPIDESHRQTWREDGLEWAPVREREDLGVDAEVFNLGVEEDESFVADGIVVHNCKHFSRAKGTALRDQGIRGLAWVVIRWAKAVRPRIIVLENVEEFQTWGPIGDDGQPDKGRAGSTFRAWLSKLASYGYSVEFRSLVAADYGAPTTRRRLYLIARRDGAGIVWPEATHGKGRPNGWRAAAEIIDWSLPCPSIFERKRPLAEATQRRIAEGIRRFVIEAKTPGPFIVRHGHYSTKTGAGLRGGCGAGTFRGQPLSDPLATVCATNDKHLVAALVTKHQGGPNGHRAIGHPVDEPMATVKARDSHGLTAAWLTKFYGTSTGASLELPLPTVTANGRGGGHLAEVRAFLLKWYGTGVGQDAQLPLHTITARDRFGLVIIHGEPYAIADIGMRMLAPHELFAAQGFPDGYAIAPEVRGKPLTKTAQIRCAGNSVCPPVAEAIVAAQVRGQASEVAA